MASDLRSLLLTLTAAAAVVLLARMAETKAKYGTTIRMETLGNCPEVSGTPNHFLSSEIVSWGKTTVGRGVFEFTQNYTRFTKVVAHIRKCADRADPHCEPFQNWRFNEESCKLLTMKNMIWSPLFNFIPILTCPVKAGRYQLENITVDLDKLKLIHFPETGFWKVSLMVDADNIPKITCFYFEGSFIRIRL